MHIEQLVQAVFFVLRALVLILMCVPLKVALYTVHSMRIRPLTFKDQAQSFTTYFGALSSSSPDLIPF